MFRVSLICELVHFIFNMNYGYDSFEGIPSPGLFPLYDELTEPRSFEIPDVLILQGQNTESILEQLGRLPLETLASLHCLLDTALSVKNDELSRNGRVSTPSNSSGETINPGGQTGTVAVGGDANDGGHDMDANALLYDVFAGNADPSSDPDSDHDESQDSDSSSEGEEVAADNDEQGKRSKYSFVKDEKKVILHRYIKKRDKLRRQGKRGTVKEVAPRVFKDIYKRGHQLGDERVQAVLQRIEEAIERNPMRKRPNVKVIINVIYNRTHNKNGSM